MNLKRDAWLIQANGKVRKIEVVFRDSGLYYYEEWDLELIEGKDHWSFDRDAMYERALAIADQKAEELKQHFVAACNTHAKLQEEYKARLQEDYKVGR